MLLFFPHSLEIYNLLFICNVIRTHYRNTKTNKIELKLKNKDQIEIKFSFKETTEFKLFISKTFMVVILFSYRDKFLKLIT